MKIIVTRSNKQNYEYRVVVLDGDMVVHTETVVGIKTRDQVVWKLAEIYNVLDIEVNKEEIKKEFRFTEIPVIPVVDDDEAEYYFEKNLNKVYDRIVEAVTEGMISSSTEIRLFELNNTGTYFTSQKQNWKAGLEQALAYYISIEAYEKCATVHSLINKL